MGRLDGSAAQAPTRFHMQIGALRSWSLGVALALAWTALWGSFIVGVEAGAPAPGCDRPAPPAFAEQLAAVNGP